MAQEMGKPVTEARGEVNYAVSFVEWYAEEAKRVYGTTVPSQAAHKRLLVQPQPVGPVYAITPWNFPAAMITRKAAPALAAGCTVVVKPAEQSPLTAVRLAELWVSAGGPADVFQVLPPRIRRGVAVFFDDPAIRKLSFTGSTEIGVLLAGAGDKTMKRMSLELGGHAPFLVFADADIDAAVKEVFASKFRNAGQTCVCANRIYVHDGCARWFAERFAAAGGRPACGRSAGRADADRAAGGRTGLAKVRAARRRCAEQRGAGGAGRPGAKGLTFMPTVLTWVAPGMRILEEETFGPVAPIVRSPTRPRRSGTPTTHPSAWPPTLDARSVARLSRRRSPRLRHRRRERRPAVHGAGSVRRDEDVSALGREGGMWGIEEYLDVKYMSIALA